MQSQQIGLRARKKAERRAEIIVAAHALFTQHGYSSVQFEDVAARADVAVGTVYNYFRTKPDLLFAIFESESRNLIREFLMLPKPGKLSDAIVAFFLQVFDTIDKIEPALWRTMVGEMMLNHERFADRFLSVEKAILAHTARIFRGRLPPGSPQRARARTQSEVLFAVAKSAFYSHIGITDETRDAIRARMVRQLRALSTPFD